MTWYPFFPQLVMVVHDRSCVRAWFEQLDAGNESIFFFLFFDEMAMSLSH